MAGENDMTVDAAEQSAFTGRRDNASAFFWHKWRAASDARR